MKTAITFFAAHRKAVGERCITLNINPGTRVEELLDMLVERYPDLGGLRSTTVVSRNHRMVEGSKALKDGDEIALLSPVGGG